MNSASTDQAELAAKLQGTLESRERQITNMAEMLAELNEKLNDALLKNRNLMQDNKNLQQRLVLNEDRLGQELKDKEIIFSKLQTLEREHERLNEKLDSMQGKGDHGGKNGKTTNKKFDFIETSKGKIDKALKAKENISYADSPQKHKEAEGSPIKLGIESVKKQDSSGSEEKGNEDEEDILERIRKNLSLTGEKKTSSTEAS